MSAPTPTHPRWFVVLVAAGIALVVAALALLVLSATGVDRLPSAVFVLVVVLAALAGGAISRVLVPKLPPLGRRG
ncbi:hypothetical protein [Modestobacter sp. NPDC049651]|uniref:hypothetical protein n=1 Tax=unclassified Modestobacter TaxID=2643866 RepID=UPI00340A2C01